MKTTIFVSKSVSQPNPSHSNTLDNACVALSLQRAHVYERAARASGTTRIYESHWKAWEAWASVAGTPVLPAPPGALAAWLADLARQGKSIATITVALTAIRARHRDAGQTLPDHHPTIRRVMAGIRRRHTNKLKQARALTLDELHAIVEPLVDGDVMALRDRAIVLVGFFGALRRSEIVALSLSVAPESRSIVEFTKQGALLHLAGTKSTMVSQTIALPRRNDDLCPVKALEAYIESANLKSGPLFRSMKRGGKLTDCRLDESSIRLILTGRAEEVGITGKLSPHSLRAGFITAAAQAGVPEHIIQRTSRHQSVDVLRKYIRTSDAFSENAGHYL